MLAFPGAQLLDVTGPLQVFATANDRAVIERSGPPFYAPRVVAAGGPLVTTSSGLSLVAAALPAADEAVDTLILAGGYGVQAAAADADLVGWVRDHAAQARRVASVCTGAFLLGAAGLLEGRRAVTHWTRCADLARCFPAARVETDPIFIRDGRIWSSAGITAGIDLALAMVEEDLGRTVALAVARHLVVFLKRPGGQAQFSATLALQQADDRFETLHAWMRENLAQDLSNAALAQHAGMSERSFARHYAQATGVTPARAVERLRIEAARRLLADTALPLKQIALRTGFGSEETLRRSFLRQLASLPQDYRARFGPAYRHPASREAASRISASGPQ